jgi:hypothetical protein
MDSLDGRAVVGALVTGWCDGETEVGLLVGDKVGILEGVSVTGRCDGAADVGSLDGCDVGSLVVGA